MSRVYANVFTDIWRDPGYRSLSADAQRAFLMLYTQPDITAAGVLSLTVRRWSNLAADTSVAGLEAAVVALEQAGWVVMDHDTEEILVVPFIRWDKGYENRNRRPVILREAAAVQSWRIGWALAEEFKALGLPLDGLPDGPPEPAPDSPRDGHPQGPPDGPSHTPSAPAPNGASSGHGDAAPAGHSTSDGVVVTTGGKSPPTRNPHSPTRNPSPKQTSARAARGARETTLPDDFALDDLLMVAATKHGMSRAVAEREFESFCAYHGSRGSRFVDWRRAWLTWVLRWQNRNCPAAGLEDSRPEWFA